MMKAPSQQQELLMTMMAPPQQQELLMTMMAPPQQQERGPTPEYKSTVMINPYFKFLDLHNISSAQNLKLTHLKA